MNPQPSPTMRVSRKTRMMLAAALAALTLTGIAYTPTAHATPATNTATVVQAANTTTDTSTGITVKATEASTLAGHKFNAYLIGTYANTQTDADGNVSSYELKGTAASNTWVKNVVDAYNTAHKTSLAAPGGQDDVAVLTKASSTQLRQLANELAAAKNKPTADAKATDVAGTGTTLKLDVPDGLYLITDSNGVSMIVSTKIAGKNFGAQTLGEMVIKSNSVELVKKLVNADGSLAANGSLTVGSTATWRMTLTLPNTGDGTVASVKIVDNPAGQKFTGNLNDITVKIGNADVTGQVTKVAGGGTVAVNSNIPNDVARPVPADGFGLSLDNLTSTYGGRQVTITAKTIITDLTKGAHPQTGIAYTSIYDGTNTPTVPPASPTLPNPGECATGTGISCSTVPVTTYGFDLNKTSFDDATVKVAGAGFVIKDETNGKYLKYDAQAGWTFITAASPDAAKTAGAELLTGDMDKNGTVTDTEKTAATAGTIKYTGLGAGTYTVTETTVPAGYSSLSKPSFTATIKTDGTIMFTGQNLPNLTKPDGSNVTVSNMTNLTQLPQTGGVWEVGSFMAAAGILAALAFGSVAVVRRKTGEANKPIATA